jgi:inactivated superfamily I helicase
MQISYFSTLRSLEIAKMAGTEWEKLNELSKQELNVAYRKELVVYDQELKKYNSQLTDEDRLKIKEARQNVVEQREKHKLKLVRIRKRH